MTRISYPARVVFAAAILLVPVGAGMQAASASTGGHMTTQRDSAIVSYDLNQNRDDKRTDDPTPQGEQVIVGDHADKPDDPNPNDGWLFTGWYTEREAQYEFDFDTDIQEDITLYAGWEKDIVTVNYNNNGHGGRNNRTDDVQVGQTISRPQAIPEESGWHFIAWYTDRAATEKFDFDNAPIMEDTTLYGGWTDVVTVDFDMGLLEDDVTPRPADEVDVGDTLDEPTNPTGPDGWSFGGWYTNSDLTDEFDSSTAITEPMTLYAKWEYLYVTVDFDLNGHGNYQPDSQEIWATHEKVTRPSLQPSASGWKFIGWYNDPNALTEFNFDTKVSLPTTLYAGWEKDMAQVEFDLNGHGDDGPDAQDVQVTHTAERPDDLQAPAGWVFTGWYTDSDATQGFDFDDEITGDTTVYAGWEKDMAQVEFDLNGHGDAQPESQEVQVSHSAERPEAPIASGWQLTGWYTDADATDEYDFSSPVTEDMTVYAGWDEAPSETSPDDDDADGGNAGYSAGRDALPMTGGTIHPGIALTAVLATLMGMVLVLRRRSHR